MRALQDSIFATSHLTRTVSSFFLEKGGSFTQQNAAFALPESDLVIMKVSQFPPWKSVSDSALDFLRFLAPGLVTRPLYLRTRRASAAASPGGTYPGGLRRAMEGANDLFNDDFKGEAKLNGLVRILAIAFGQTPSASRHSDSSPPPSRTQGLFTGIGGIEFSLKRWVHWIVYCECVTCPAFPRVTRPRPTHSRNALHRSLFRHAARANRGLPTSSPSRVPRAATHPARKHSTALHPHALQDRSLLRRGSQR